MGQSLRAIAEAIGGRLSGDPELVVGRIRALDRAQKGDLAILFDRKHADEVPSFTGSALVVPEDFPDAALTGRSCIRVRHPRASLVEILRLFHPERRRAPGIAPGAFVSAGARVDPSAFVAAGAVVEDGASIGGRSEVHANAVLGEGVSIGEDTIVYPNVTLYPGTRLGNRVRVHAGTVIGADGFGFPRQKDGSLLKVPQVGRVEVEDDVEIGANCTIDRATLEETRIGRGTKIDNLVQIGHNSVVGTDCCIMGQVGISGSVRVGSFATLCGQVGIADQVTLAEHVTVGAQSGVPWSLSEGVWLGTPALLATQMRRVYPALARLPETRREIRELADRLERLEALLQREHESR